MSQGSAEAARRRAARGSSRVRRASFHRMALIGLRDARQGDKLSQMVRQAILTPNWLKAKLPRDVRPVRFRASQRMAHALR